MTKGQALKVAKPILFNTDMIRAIQDNFKTVTRRIIKVPDTAHMFYGIDEKTQSACFLCGKTENGFSADWEVNIKLPYQIGDVLYVRETWFYESHMHDLTAGKPDLPGGRYSHRYIYKANSPDYPVDVGVGARGWRPSIHMPKEAARIFLRVTNVRVERLQDMTDEDCVKDGGFSIYSIQAVGKERLFGGLWNCTIKKSDLAKYGWAANPWVWVIEFEKVEVQNNG